MALDSSSVLVVDDIPENRDLLVRRLKRLGIGYVEEACNGREALAAIERKSFDLVLLDIMMPEMNGYEVLEHLNKLGRVQDPPVVVISALNEIDPVVRCIELGAEDFLYKPFNPTLLRARVKTTLEKKALRDAMRDELGRKRHELNEARTLQLALRPPSFRGIVGGRSLRVDSVLEPAKEVGGDLVDHFFVGDDLFVIILGDVSDKGAGAALMMARTHALFRALASRPDAVDLFSAPENAVRLVNVTLAEGNLSCMFVTLLIATLEVATGRFCYVRAGHVPPFLHRAKGSMERLHAAGGLPLGILETANYKSTWTELLPGDEFLVVTDGITEAFDPSDTLFGEARLRDLFTECVGSLENPLERLLSAVRNFEAGGRQSDDIAAIFLTTSMPAEKHERTATMTNGAMASG